MFDERKISKDVIRPKEEFAEKHEQLISEIGKLNGDIMLLEKKIAISDNPDKKIYLGGTGHDDLEKLIEKRRMKMEELEKMT